MAAEATGRDPQFTDKEKINLEIYASVRMMQRNESAIWS